MILDTFSKEVLTLLEKTYQAERETMIQAAKLMSDVIQNDGLIYTFGTGHSHLIAEEVFYRAGGLVPLYAMIEDGVSGNHEVTKSEHVERLHGYAKLILDYHRPTSNDVVIIVSNSGRNAVPVEMALECRQRNIPTICITSVTYSKGQSSRHESGQRLFEVCDIVLDNHSKFGDAATMIDGFDQPVGPTSNITAGYIIHGLIVQTIENLVQAGIDVPVFYSGNLDGAREKNDVFLNKYWSRIRVF